MGLKFATLYTYTFLNVSARPINDRWRIGPGFGIGVRVPALPKLFFEPDVSATHLVGNTACCSSPVSTAVARRRDESHLRLRSSFRYEFAKHFSLFAGAAVLGRITYPVINGDTEVTVEGLLEGFGGVDYWPRKQMPKKWYKRYFSRYRVAFADSNKRARSVLSSWGWPSISRATPCAQALGVERR